MKAIALAVALFLTASPGFAGTSSEAIQLNNQGVRALNNSDWQNSIKYFEDCLKREPRYDLARHNLSIAYNNFGLSLKTKDEAINYFHKAVFLGPDNKTSVANLNGFIKSRYGKNPEEAATRIHFADLAAKKNDLIGAYVELKAALEIKTDSNIKKKLDDVCNQIRTSEKYSEFEKALLNPENNLIIGNRRVKKLDVVPGILKEERKALIGAIQIAESQGVGISNYMTAFQSIEKQVEDGASADTIQKELSRIYSALSNQVKLDDFSFSPNTKYRPKTKYLLNLKTYLKDNLKFMNPTSSLKISFSVNRSGKFTNIKCGDSDKYSSKIYDQISEKLRTLDNVPPPPTDQLELSLNIDKKGELELSLKNSVKFDKYLEFIERKMKNNWNPPKRSVMKPIKVIFTVELNGKISDVKVTQPDEDQEQNKAAIKAVNDSAPLPYLPDGCTESVTSQMTFTYNVRKR